MNSAKFISKIAFFYKEPLVLEKLGKQIQNPRLVDTHQWVVDNFPDEMDFTDFYKLVLEGFTATTSNSFPGPATLSKIWADRPVKPKKYIPFSERDMIEGYVVENGVSKNPEPGVDIKKMDDDDIKLSAYEMLKKYGIIACGEFWKGQGEKELDEHPKNPDYFQD